MAIKVKKGVYKCLFCNFTSGDPKVVDAHRDSEHEYILLPITKEELARLIQFIWKKDDKLIGDLYSKLKEYLNNFGKKDSILEEME
jgi:hypothetical protein